MKKLLTVALSLLMACTLLISALCVGGLSVSAAITATFVDTIQDFIDVPEIVDYSSVGDDPANMHRMACENNFDLGTNLLIKAAGTAALR